MRGRPRARRESGRPLRSASILCSPTRRCFGNWVAGVRWCRVCLPFGSGSSAGSCFRTSSFTAAFPVALGRRAKPARRRPSLVGKRSLAACGSGPIISSAIWPTPERWARAASHIRTSAPSPRFARYASARFIWSIIAVNCSTAETSPTRDSQQTLHKPAVDLDRGASDIAGPLGREEYDQIRELVRPAHPPHRNSLLDLL